MQLKFNIAAHREAGFVNYLNTQPSMKLLSMSDIQKCKVIVECICKKHKA